MCVPSLHNNQEVLLLLAEGNEKAFKVLFDKYSQRLYYYICRFVKSNQVAKELASETFRSPLRAVMVNSNGGSLPGAATGVQLSMKGVVLTAFGKNPDGDGTILRLWEQAGNSGPCTVTLPANHPYKTYRLCNLRGEPLSTAVKVSNTFDVDIKAYQPVSIQLQ